jgi:hypothetical protein
LQAAKDQSALVRLRQHTFRKDLVAVLNPEYGFLV